MIQFYFDVHVPFAIAEQLRPRDVDVLHAITEGNGELPDDLLLEQSTTCGRVLVTTDHRFRAMAERWQSESRLFAGLIYLPSSLGVGTAIKRLEIIAKTSESVEWVGQVMWLQP